MGQIKIEKEQRQIFMKVSWNNKVILVITVPYLIV